VVELDRDEPDHGQRGPSRRGLEVELGQLGGGAEERKHAAQRRDSHQDDKGHSGNAETRRTRSGDGRQPYKPGSRTATVLILGPSDHSAGDYAAHYTGANCIVTGGLGFIGSNLTIALVEAGALVTVVDSLEPRHGGDRRNVAPTSPEVVIADIGDASAVSEPLASADYVFNLAGQVSHIDSMTDPVRDLDLNARSQLLFLELLRRIRPQARVVFTSSRQVYGRPQSVPVDETHPVRPVDVNGVSKLAAEQFHLLYHQVYEIPVAVLRLSNVYGPRQRLAGDHQGFLAVFIRQALRGETITLFGDGSQQRDCLYVDDAVAALLGAGAAPAAVGQTLNIGHPHSRSLDEIARTLVTVAGSGEIEIRPWPSERERIAIGSFQTDSSKARSLIGWRPTVELEEGAERTLAYYRDRPEWPA
jgi:UDP-glucose 4-epimerase